MTEAHFDPQGRFISPKSTEISSEIEHDFREIESVPRLNAIHRKSQYIDTLLDQYCEGVGDIDTIRANAVKEQAVLSV